MTFSGTFLSTIPFAARYGVVKDFMTLEFEASRLVDFSCANDGFWWDFTRYLDHNAGNRIVEEFGIGTNLGELDFMGITLVLKNAIRVCIWGLEAVSLQSPPRSYILWRHFNFR